MRLVVVDASGDEHYVSAECEELCDVILRRALPITLRRNFVVAYRGRPVANESSIGDYFNHGDHVQLEAKSSDSKGVSFVY